MPKSGVVVIFKNSKKIKFLVGDKFFENITLKPYEPLVCKFLENLSKKLNNSIYNRYPEIKSLSFWCRKKNIDKIKKNFSKIEIRTGIGLIFHITPSNVPINFAYSLIFGLLTGNSNVIKVPSKNFDQVTIICNEINNLLKKNNFRNIKKLIKVIRYDQENEGITKFLSSICNVRIIWGGDKSIEHIRKFPIKSRSFDLTFADRYSICLINSDKINNLNKINLSFLIKKFYNDTFLFDQNACSSPHLILWLGSSVKKARNKFWINMNSLLENKYFLPEKSAYDKYNQLCLDSINLKNINIQNNFGGMIYNVVLKKIEGQVHNLRGKWGYFYEYEIKKLDEVKKLLNNKFQTMTYFGIKKKSLENFARSNLKGIDRIVPIGQASDISMIWDGYDLNNTLTRIIDVK